MASAKRKRNSTGLNATPNAGGRTGFVPQTPQTPLTNSSATHPAKRKKVKGSESSKKKPKREQQREESQELPYISSPASAKRTSATIAANGHHHHHHDAPSAVPETLEPEIPIDPALRGEPVAIPKPQDHVMQDADQTEIATPRPQKEVTRVSSAPSALARQKKGRRVQADDDDADDDDADDADSNSNSNKNKNPAGKTGFFSPDEIQKLEAFKLEFCTMNGVEADTFDMMVQHSVRERQEQWPVHTDIITKPDFWARIYEIIPDRAKRSVYRFMRRHFQCSSQKPHHWTHEQDEELISLHRLHGAKWAYIAKMIGRSDDDVVQRWKNRLQHRRTMNRGSWSEQEVQDMMDALQEVWHTMKATGVDVGQDVYELDEVYIAWGVVSDKMNNCRSRQQCADKWRKLRAKVLNQRRKENPDAFHDSAVVKKSGGSRRSKSRAVSTPQQKPNQKFKSKEIVESEDEDGSQEAQKAAEKKDAQESEVVEESDQEEEEEEEDESAEPEVPIKHERHSMELDDAHMSPPSKQPAEAIRHITNTDSREDSVADELSDSLVDWAIKDERRQKPDSESEEEEEEEEEEESPSPNAKREVKPNLGDAESESESESGSESDESEEENYSTPPSGQRSANLKVTSPNTVTKSSQQQQRGGTIKPRSPSAVAIKSRKSPSPTASATSSEDEDEDEEEEEEESGGSDSDTSSTGGDWPAKPTATAAATTTTTTPNRKPSTNSSPITTAKRTVTTIQPTKEPQQLPTKPTVTHSKRTNPTPPESDPETASEDEGDASDEDASDTTSSSSKESSRAPKQQPQPQPQPQRPSIPTRPSFGSSSQPTRPPGHRLSVKELRDASLSKANSNLKAPKPNTLNDIMSDAKSRAKADSSSSDDDESSDSDSDSDSDSE
ncbi:hypothetical protein BO99DRAFT_131889 [Aspergillus violaceofuscus CBS 115571]|uniref:MYB DNA-binding domain protein n=1 Tax=Aspergillus violaceofuscus (strain CBS 115571) TaxID=1450538 RepID=A0A2V5HC00_ASPV1|nr:hypothetical protein BO99DRAFT_131889 [Aspergillus violaceofuscus CBS 115571]